MQHAVAVCLFWHNIAIRVIHQYYVLSNDNVISKWYGTGGWYHHHSLVEQTVDEDVVMMSGTD